MAPHIPHPLPEIPKFSKVNRFKLAYITLRSKVGHPKPFENLSAHGVQSKINQVLKDVNAKVYEESIFVSAVVKFTNGTIKLCAKNKASVRWLLENKHKRSNLADPSFITSPNLYHVIIHSCPVFFDISDESDISELCKQNNIDCKEVKKVRWLKTPNIEEKDFGSLVILFENRNLAYDIIKGVYNTPAKFEGLRPLKSWLTEFSLRSLPTIIVIDSNLHHPLWNPPSYCHSHPKAKEFLKIMEGKSLYLTSPMGIPTFLSQHGSATTIDHLWANPKARNLITSVHIQLNNHASDHQPVTTNIALNFQQNISKLSHISMKLSDLDHTKLQEDVLQDLQHIPLTTENMTGKKININATKHKPWWDEKTLTPLVRGRNKARKWALINKKPEAKNFYQEWQLAFKTEIKRLKNEHWRKFLAESSPNHAFQAYKFKKLTKSDNILPLKENEGNLTLDNKLKVQRLFEGTSVIQNLVDMSDINPRNTNTPLFFPPITMHKLSRAVEELPKKKAPGPNQILNELLKIISTHLTPYLKEVFNGCLQNCYFPSMWKRALTAIIRKSGKDNYSDPRAYCPIALLNTLGKLFEKIINDRLSFWEEYTGSLANGHMGGRPGRSIYDAFGILTSWIKAQWHKGKIVMGLFLDISSAYPLVVSDRLIHIITEKNCPPYLISIIKSFLNNCSTIMKLDSYTSDPVDIDRGLPQGSPLLVTLYLLYNSALLVDNLLTLDDQEILLGFVDDVAHLVSDSSYNKSLKRLHVKGNLSLNWGLKHGAVFDKKKAKVIVFSHKKIAN
ncbi:hypothetical protein O181_056419 [Austropuccinia psidii MF-1]|uniref:Reverse transcriptase domain-containing protein n=1 Tax=Austropuccinia psidii MF-1 TaxID=1389203 RepID=A0A9Q3E8F6_9BASI|nr:hypothetical protein [Austropuccinia psidii MF-1]